MCKDCGCSLGGEHTHEHSHGGYSHSHAHSHEHGEGHDHSHEHANPALGETKTVEVIQKILGENDHEAEHVRAHLDEHGILCVNLMSSPGAGKTTLLEATIKSGAFKIGVVEGDLETNRDADRIIKAGGEGYQITTGQTCHLDAFMVHEGLHHINLNDKDIVFIENVGNLVCPASYDVGAHLNAVLLSVPEGSDKVEKYPVMFRRADVVLITKTSLLPYFDFSVEDVKKSVRRLNPKADIIEIDSAKGEGLDKWLNYLKMKKEFR